MDTKTTKGGFYMVTEEITFDANDIEVNLEDEVKPDEYEFFPDTSI